MTDTNEFIENFLAHDYDPVKAREYYLRTRKLKGRKPGTAINPRSKVGYNGKPLKPIGKRMEEDETPDVSPSGAKLTDYDGGGLGKAWYADGTVYDARVGWKNYGKGVDSTRARNNTASKTNSNPRRRIGNAEQKLIRAKTLANRVKDPKAKAALFKRLAATEKKLKAAQTRHAVPPARKG